MTAAKKETAETQVNAENLEDIRRGQLNIVASQARMEGQVEGIKLAVEGINSQLAGVADVRADIAVLKERDGHADPEITRMTARIVLLEKSITVMEKAADKQWVEGLVKFLAAGVGGGAIAGLVQYFN